MIGIATGRCSPCTAAEAHSAFERPPQVGGRRPGDQVVALPAVGEGEDPAAGQGRGTTVPSG